MAERTDVAVRMRTEIEGPERSAREIRQDIAAKRESISETVDKLGERIQETLDWREYVAEYPYVALGAAAGLGFLVSAIFKPRPTPQERIVDALADLIEDGTGRLRDSLGDVVPKKMGPGKTLKAALTAALTKAALDYGKKRLSGTFSSEGSHVQTRQPISRASAADRADFEPAIPTPGSHTV
jgi:ElaB/YqjD/DUF883 family membrane-anchored ribosome-binding protein